MSHPFDIREGLMSNDKKQHPPRSLSSSVVVYLNLRAHRETLHGSELSEEALEEMIRDSIDELLEKLPSEKRLEGLAPEQRVDGLSVEQVGNALPLVELEALVQQQKDNGPIRESAVSHLCSVAGVLHYSKECDRPRERNINTLFDDVEKAYAELPARDKSSKRLLEEFARQTIADLLKALPLEKRLEGLPPEECLKGLSVEQVVQVLPPEALEGMETLVRQRKANDPSSKPL